MRSADGHPAHRARPPPAAADGQSQREPVIINDTQSPESAGCDSLPRAVLRAVLAAPGAASVCWRCCASPPGRDSRSATAASPRSWRARPSGVIESSYDALSGLYTRTGIRTARPGDRRRAHAQRTPWSALYIDCRPAACHQRQLRHARRRHRHRAARRADPRPPAARRACARVSPVTASRVLLPTGVDRRRALRRVAARRRRDAGRAAGRTRACSVSISIGVAPLETGRGGELAHSLAAAETACKAAKDRGRNRVEIYQAAEPEHRAPLLRHRRGRRSVREALDPRPAAAARAADPALRRTAREARPHFELLLRMIDENGSTVGPDTFLSAAMRYQLMADDRPLGRQRASSTLLKPHASSCSGQAVRVLRSTSPASP